MARRMLDTPEKGLTKEDIEASLNTAFDDFEALPENIKTWDHARQFKWTGNMFVTKGSVSVVQIPLGFLIAAEIGKTAVSAIAEKLSAGDVDIFKPFRALPVGETEAEAIEEDKETADKPIIVKQNQKIIGRKVKITLAKRPTYKIRTGGEGSAAGTEVTRRLKRYGFRIPSQIPIVSVGIFLQALNEAVGERKYISYFNEDTMRIEYGIPNAAGLTLEKDKLPEKPTKVNQPGQA